MKEREKRPKPIRIEKDEWMLKMEDTLRAYSQMFMEAQLGLANIEATSQLIRRAEAEGLSIRFYEDEGTGELFVEVGKKGPMGFRVPM